MSSFSYHALRTGLAITFIWIGIMIVRDPVSWGAFIQPWVLGYLPISLNELMMGAGILDIVVGGLMFFNLATGIVSIVAAAHILGVLAVSGIDEVTVRDIGLLGASMALAVEAFKR